MKLRYFLDIYFPYKSLEIIPFSYDKQYIYNANQSTRMPYEQMIYIPITGSILQNK